MKSRVIFRSEIIASDDFYDLPDGAQRLYFRLNAEANQDGRVIGVRQILRAIGSDASDLSALVAAGFMLDCGTGSYFVRDWWIHNLFDRHNCRHVGESPELLDGLIAFTGEACKSPYCLLVGNAEEESLSKACEQTCNSNPKEKVNQKKTNANSTPSVNETQREIESLEISRCPICGREVLPPSESPDGLIFDCFTCEKVLLTPDGTTMAQKW